MRRVLRSGLPPRPGITLNRNNPLSRRLVAAWVPGATPGIPGRGKGTGIIRDMVYGNHAIITDLDVVPNNVFGMGVYNNATAGDWAAPPVLLPVYREAGFLSVSAWILPGAIGNGIYAICVNDPYNMGAYVRCWQFRINAKKIHMIVWNQSGTIGDAKGATDLTTLSGAIHTVGTWDGAVIRVYVNGILDGQADLAGTSMATMSHVPFIGYRYANLDNNPFLGTIGPTMLWRRGLTADEVWQLWHPATRWSLFEPSPRRQVYAVAGGAPPAGRRRSSVIWIG